MSSLQTDFILDFINYNPELTLKIVGGTIFVLVFINVVFGKSRVERLYSKTRRKGIEALRKMSWQDFERFTGAFFGKRGYKVKLCGLGGADGGMDLLITKKGEKTLVQCKHWKGRVGVTTVREMFGIMHAESYDGVIIVALSGFTREAKEWAKNKPIQLLAGTDMLK